MLAGGLPFNRIGSGPAVVALQGLMFENRALSGFEARFMLGPYRPLAERRSFYVVNRRPGLPAGSTLGDMAADYAAMIGEEFEPPVDVVGISSGGSIAFYLAAEHPEVVRRLVIQDCGCRLTENGRAWQREAARLAEAGDWRGVSRLMMGAVWPDDPLGRTMAWLFSPLMAMSAPDDPSDMIALIEAEDAHDFTSRLPEIAAPTLVACGELDPFSGAALAQETAAGIPDGRAIVYAGRRHGIRGKAFERDLVEFLTD
jgi:pimeloyl-ACP methyl ester carboxylesterase